MVYELPDHERYADAFDGGKRPDAFAARNPELYLRSGHPIEALAPVDFEGNLVHEAVQSALADERIVA